MKDRASVAVIIPTYNRSAMLREAIDSVLALSYPANEVIVVNDGSTDDTEAVVLSYGNRVRLINKENGGKSSALNAGLTVVSSDYVLICDDDDLVDADSLGALALLLDNDRTLDCVMGQYAYFNSEKKNLGSCKVISISLADEPNFKINFLENMTISLGAILVRRAVYEKVGFFSAEMIRNQDYEMLNRILRYGRAAYLPKVVCYCRLHDGDRGSVVDRFAIRETEKKWLQYEKITFRKIYAQYALSEYTPTFALNLEESAKKRASYLERALVMAKRGLWEEACRDFDEIANLSESFITQKEMLLSERLQIPFVCWDILYESPALLQKFSKYSREEQFFPLFFELSRSLVWQSKVFIMKADLRRFYRAIWLLYRILGLRGMMFRILTSIID